MVEPALKPSSLPVVRGRYTANAPLGEVGWFRTGGRAEILYKPADREDLIDFMSAVSPDIPVMVLGVLSNTIVRDGGVPGVVIRLGRDFATIEPEEGSRLRAGAAALDVNVAEVAGQNGIAGLEFLSGVPGTIGGALLMNAGAYGGEVKDVLIEADLLQKNGTVCKVSPQDLNMTYRHTDTPEGAIFLGALFQGKPDHPETISARMTEIRERRAATQPIKSQTGGSTFANPTLAELSAAGLPSETKTWQLVDRVGGRGLRIGGAQMSEQHANFMINTGTASAQDLEDLGEEIRRRVKGQCGIDLRWEIKRIGIPAFSGVDTILYK
jgi:UDP-N-acetylmuramate dehydrogenase